MITSLGAVSKLGRVPRANHDESNNQKFGIPAFMLQGNT